MINVTEKATPKIVVQPAAIAESMLLAASGLPVKTRGLNIDRSRSVGISGSILEVIINKEKDPIMNNTG